jgi:hypothetical protein
MYSKDYMKKLEAHELAKREAETKPTHPADEPIKRPVVIIIGGNAYRFDPNGRPGTLPIVQETPVLQDGITVEDNWGELDFESLDVETKDLYHTVFRCLRQLEGIQ